MTIGKPFIIAGKSMFTTTFWQRFTSNEKS
jgi:hypothetical protein